MYTAAERERALSRPLDPQRVQSVLRSTPDVKDVSDPDPAGTGRLFFIFPIRRDVYHNFRWDDVLFGHVKHAERGRRLHLGAYTLNRRPDGQTRRRARQLLERLEERLLDADPAVPVDR